MPVGVVPSLGDEQAMLLDASTRLMDERHPLAEVRRRADEGGALAAGYTEACGGLGWFGLLATEAAGGGSASGNGVLDAALLAAERGARLQPGPFVGHSIVVDALTRAGSHHEVLGALVDGAGWATWAFAETSGLTVETTGDGLRLSGTVAPVADLADCAWVLVHGDGPHGAVQVLLSTDAPGLTVRPLVGLDVSRTWAALDLDGVTVEATAVVGTPGPATEAALRWQAQLSAVLVAAETVGTMDTDVALAVQYAKDRIAFGRPIGSFQAIKHLLADTSLWLEMAKGLVAVAATALGTGDPDGPSLAHAAKSFVGEKGVETGQNCFQVFGGIGYTWEHDQHLYLRRLVADAATFGSPAWHRRQLLDEEGVA